MGNYITWKLESYVKLTRIEFTIFSKCLLASSLNYVKFFELQSARVKFSNAAGKVLTNFYQTQAFEIQ